MRLLSNQHDPYYRVLLYLSVPNYLRILRCASFDLSPFPSGVIDETSQLIDFFSIKIKNFREDRKKSQEETQE